MVNCVGILYEVGRNKFSDVQAEGAARIARLASEHGVSNLVHISAIGADENGASTYAVTKAHGEAAIQEHFPNVVILRPSIIFGSEDQFFNRFAQMAASLPVLPISGANSKFQPVWHCQNKPPCREACWKLATQPCPILYPFAISKPALRSSNSQLFLCEVSILTEKCRRSHR